MSKESVFTSNIFAIMGLRALYFLLADVADRFHLLKYGLAMVLTLKTSGQRRTACCKATR